MKKSLLTILGLFLLASTCFAEEVTCPVGTIFRIKNSPSVRFEVSNPSICSINETEVVMIAPGTVNIKAYASWGKRIIYFEKDYLVY